MNPIIEHIIKDQNLPEYFEWRHASDRFYGSTDALADVYIDFECGNITDKACAVQIKVNTNTDNLLLYLAKPMKSAIKIGFDVIEINLHDPSLLERARDIFTEYLKKEKRHLDVIKLAKDGKWSR